MRKRNQVLSCLKTFEKSLYINYMLFLKELFILFKLKLLKNFNLILHTLACVVFPILAKSIHYFTNKIVILAQKLNIISL